jgi:hypothetical protein
LTSNFFCSCIYLPRNVPYSTSFCTLIRTPAFSNLTNQSLSALCNRNHNPTVTCELMINDGSSWLHTATIRKDPWKAQCTYGFEQRMRLLSRLLHSSHLQMFNVLSRLIKRSGHCSIYGTCQKRILNFTFNTRTEQATSGIQAKMGLHYSDGEV